MSKADDTAWLSEGRKLNPQADHPGIPVHILLAEATDAAGFFKSNWKCTFDEGGAMTHPGLELANGPVTAPGSKKRATAPKVVRLAPMFGDELLALVSAVQTHQSAYQLASGAASAPGKTDPVVRARFILDEITTTMEWFCDDDVQDEKDSTLATLRSTHSDDPDTPAALASELSEWAAFAGKHRDEIDGLVGFDAAYLDEVNALAKALRGGSTERSEAAAKEEKAQRDALEKRNLVAAVLRERLRKLRAAARAVFRNEPERARAVGSVYERRRRAATRLAAQKKSESEAEKKTGN